jgi:hypothetical protein
MGTDQACLRNGHGGRIREAAFEWLEKAIVNGDRRFAWMRRNPHLAALREDPRFERVLKQHAP